MADPGHPFPLTPIANLSRMWLELCQDDLPEALQDPGLIARLRGARGLERGLFREGDGIVRNGKKILMSHDNVLTLAKKYGIDMEGVAFPAAARAR